MDVLTNKIRMWAIERNLDQGSTHTQFTKVVEEIGEIAEGIAKGDHGMFIDGIGDVFVTLVILAMRGGVDIEQCVQVAYNEIKDRTGEMRNGVFVKQEDL